MAEQRRKISPVKIILMFLLRALGIALALAALSAAYPSLTGEWMPGVIDTGSFEGDWQFLMDGTHPSCRSLNRPYAGADKNNFLTT